MSESISFNPRAWDWETGRMNDTKIEQTRVKEQAAAEAKQKVLLEQAAEEEKRTARERALAKTTSGFGANTNLARSFLSSL